MFDFIKANPESIDEKRLEYFTLIISCLNVFYTDILDFYELDESYIRSVNNRTFEDHFQVLNNKLEPNPTFDSVFAIFNLIYRALKSSEPRLRTEKYFEYKGEKWVFPTVWKDNLFGTNGFNSPSVKQAIELLQAQSNYAAMVKDLAKNSEDSKNHLFAKYLTEISVMLVKEGEELPLDSVGFKKFMHERMEFFQDIDFQTAIDLEHWFNEYYLSLESDKVNHFYFNSKSPEDMDEVQARNKAANKNKEVSDKTGWHSLYARLIEIGSFFTGKESAIDSVSKAPFTDAVKIISLDNSK